MTEAVDLLRQADTRLVRLASLVPAAESNMALTAADGFPPSTPGARPATSAPSRREVNPDEVCDLTPVEAAVTVRSRAAGDHDELLRAIARLHAALDDVAAIVNRHLPATALPAMCTGGRGMLDAERWGAPDRCGDPAERGSVLCPRHRKAKYRWELKTRSIETTATEDR